MRSTGTGCTFQQALTPDAACVVKQAVTLARRRGHAQVTPLHVASTMLSSSSSSALLRSACQQSHSHPLQCRALELCFNVALNRLPTTASSSPPMSPMLGGPPLSISHHQQHQHQQSPSISHALVAAFKRAQAHQRRGSIENQQQPLLAVKIELEQLVISILDDPSVSRVMREAGFSSPLVKLKVEQAVIALETTTSSDFKNCNNVDTSNNHKSGTAATHIKDSGSSITSTVTTALSGVFKGERSVSRVAIDEATRSDDAMRVMDGLVESRSKRSCCVVVIGECLSTLESAIQRATGKLERGDMDVPDLLKEVKLVPLSLGVIDHLSCEGVTQKVAEIKSLVRSCVNNKGVVFYLGDLERATTKLMVDSDGCGGGEELMTGSRYCPIKHMIMELRRLVLEFSDESRLWLVGLATFQTYTKCRGENPNSLESIWGLHPVTIPAGSLRLSLVPESDLQSSRPLTTEKGVGGVNSLLTTEGKQREDKTTQTSFSSTSSRTCCNIESITKSSSSGSSLPSWLQKCKDDHENQKSPSNDDNRRHQETFPVEDLCKRWINSSACSITHISHPAQSLERSSLSFSMSPSSSLRLPAYSHFNSPSVPLSYSHVAHQPKSFWFGGSNSLDYQQPKALERTPLITTYAPDPHQNQATPISSSSTTNMTSSFNTASRFKKHNAENLRTLCNALERKVPWQKDIIPDIAGTVLHCRGGRVKRSGVNNNNIQLKEETWFFFQGVDGVGKEQIGRELASLVFGSSSKFISIGLSCFSPSTRTMNSMEVDPRNKRLRNELSCSYLERLVDAVSTDPHRVFFLDDIEQTDYCSQMGIKRACETGKLRRLSGEEVGLGDSIIILSSDQCLTSGSRACSPSTKQRIDCHGTLEDKQGGGSYYGSLDDSPSLSLDLNLSISDDHGGVDQRGYDDRLLSSNVVDDVGLVAAVDKCIVFRRTGESVHR